MRGPRNLSKAPLEPAVLPLDQCLAKSLRLPDGTTVPGRSVLSHCQVVGEVARAMIAQMPAWLRASLFPPGSCLVAAAHDIGKVSPSFQKKIYSAMSAPEENIWAALQSASTDEIHWGGHAGISQVTAKTFLGERSSIPEILGQHHGYSLTQKVSCYSADAGVFGGAPWKLARLELLTQLQKALDCEFPKEGTFQAPVLAGLTSVADWIGSGPWFDHAEDDGPEKIQKALQEAGYIHPQIHAGLTFQEVFGFPSKQIQEQLVHAANQPGVYVLEAPMGMGKTEAALFAVYQLLQKHQATGIYFALPTQLTSNKIHERMNAFLQKILTEESVHRQSLLLHGDAFLVDTGGEEMNPGGAWFVHGKRGILSPFAVGTIDQALMAVLNVKHGFVRRFGLVGKVVILDEVHSYDSFTGTILDELVQALRELHCTVIILSATLTRERRKELIYHQDERQREGADVFPHKNAYPLITARPYTGEVLEIETDPIPDVSVWVQTVKDVETSLEEALRRAQGGQQVLWIENTVKEAQTRYQRLAARSAEIGVACGLLHSRFTRKDRAEKEAEWVTLYSKDSTQRQETGRILVGTQVLEQSLDIDADFLVTRMAPTDMLLQRIGRLWRHAGTVRPEGSRQEVWILAPDLEEAIERPDEAFGTSAKVYAPYVLCRSLEVWRDCAQISLPGQIRDQIEATYSQREEHGKMAEHWQKLNDKREKMKRLAGCGLSGALSTTSDDAAQTRYNEVDSVDVLLMRSYEESGTKAVKVVLADGTCLSVPRDGRSLPRPERLHISRHLRENMVTVAAYGAPRSVSQQKIDWLRDYWYIGEAMRHESLLRVALIDSDGKLKSVDGFSPALEGQRISYRQDMGYVT